MMALKSIGIGLGSGSGAGAGSGAGPFGINPYAHVCDKDSKIEKLEKEGIGDNSFMCR